MREIKFRAYNKKYGIHDGMQEVTSLFPRRKAVMCTNWRCKFEDIELMQYTGLKDKNGVEIYEGDIVIMHYFFENYDSASLGAYEDEAEIKGVIHINEYGTYVETSDKQQYFWNLYLQEPTEELEVIGNIYENPELLEVGE